MFSSSLSVSRSLCLCLSPRHVALHDCCSHSGRGGREGIHAGQREPTGDFWGLLTALCSLERGVWTLEDVHVWARSFPHRRRSGPNLISLLWGWRVRGREKKGLCLLKSHWSAAMQGFNIEPEGRRTHLRTGLLITHANTHRWMKCMRAHTHTKAHRIWDTCIKSRWQAGRSDFNVIKCCDAYTEFYKAASSLSLVTYPGRSGMCSQLNFDTKWKEKKDGSSLKEIKVMNRNRIG